MHSECVARFEKAFGRESKAPETPAPKEFLSYEELMLPRPEPRAGGEHLSDYEPSEAGIEESPAVPAVFRHQKPGALVLFEIVSHSGSRLSSVANDSGVRVVSISCDKVDFDDPSVIDQLDSQVSALPGCCLCGSLFSDGWGFRQCGYGYWKAHRTLLSFLQVASVVIANGGEVVLEWPRDSSCWMLPEVQAFEDQFGLRKVSFDGCAIGLVSLSGVPYDAPWQIMTSSKCTIDNFQSFRCSHSSATKHCSARTLGPRVTHYPETFHKVLLVSLFPSAFQSPALPCVPSLPQLHRDKDSRPRILLDVLMHESGVKEVKIPGLVHRLLDRKEWAGQPGAHEAIKKEKDGLVEVGAWLEEEIISESDVLAWASRTSNVVHFENLMIILSVKGSELSPDQWRLQARIVFRGDDIRDQSGMSAVFEELFASSPSYIEGLNTAVAFGLLESHGVTTSDAVRAYTQAKLKTKHSTYVLLPPELVPPSKKHIVQPCAPLHKALFGHPESSAYWQQHLHEILLKLGGEEFPNLPSVYFFKPLGFVLCVSVDDLTLSGRRSLHDEFWRSLSQKVELEPFAR